MKNILRFVLLVAVMTMAEGAESWESLSPYAANAVAASTDVDSLVGNLLKIPSLAAIYASGDQSQFVAMTGQATLPSIQAAGFAFTVKTSPASTALLRAIAVLSQAPDPTTPALNIVNGYLSADGAFADYLSIHALANGFYVNENVAWVIEKMPSAIIVSYFKSSAFDNSSPFFNAGILSAIIERPVADIAPAEVQARIHALRTQHGYPQEVYALNVDQPDDDFAQVLRSTFENPAANRMTLFTIASKRSQFIQANLPIDSLNIPDDLRAALKEVVTSGP